MGLRFIYRCSKKIKDVFGLLSGIGKVGKIFSLFTNPIGIAILAIGALVTAFVVAYKKSETFRNFVDKAFEGIKKPQIALVNL